MEPEIPAGSTQIGQDARGAIGQTVIGATVFNGSVGSVTIIEGSQAGASEAAASPAATDDTTPSAPTPAEEGPNPYQGLLAFQPSDGDRFFGRAKEIEDLWQRFRALHEQADATRLLVVYGPSGSGKPSLVRAGLVPELARRPPGGRAQARIALLVPGSQPLQELAGVLARIATNDPTPASKTREFAEELALANGAGEFDGLQRIARLLPEADVWPLVVVVDQLEELYSLRPEAAERQAFLATLLRAAADRSGQVAVVVTLRSDFLGATQADPALNQLIQAQGVFVAALSEAGLRDAIRLPAEQRDRPLDAASVELLVEQSLGRDGALPLLQFALLRIWEGLLRGQPAAETLRQIGGVGGALAGEADRIQASLPAEDQRIARRLFLNLVQLGEGSRDTRRRVALWEVIGHGEEPAAVRRVIERFASPAVRLITRSGGQDGSETLELSHEALIEAWPALREWLNSSRADLRFQRRLEEAARHWQEKGKPEGSLWRPPDLDLLEQFRKEHDADLTIIQAEFANGSRQADQAQQRRDQRTQSLLRGGLVALSGLTLLALGSGGFAWHQLRQAQAAQALQFEATHRELLDSDPFSSLVYGLAAAEQMLGGHHPWEAAQLSKTLMEAAVVNRSVSMPISTGSRVTALIQMTNGEVITGDGNGTLRRWRGWKLLGNGEPISSGHRYVRTLIEMKDGELISVGPETLRRWRDGKPVGDGKAIPTGQGGVTSLIELKSGEVITGGSDGTIRRWRNWKPVGHPTKIASSMVTQLLELKNHDLLMLAVEGSLWRLRKNRIDSISRQFTTGQGRLVSLLELRNGEIITGGSDGTLRRWRNWKPVGVAKTIATGKEVNVLHDLIELKNGDFISWSEGGLLQRWRVLQPVANRRPLVMNKRVSKLVELNNGDLISGGWDGTIRRWRDLQPIGVTKPIATGQGWVMSLLELKNGDLISGGWDGSLRRWRNETPLDKAGGITQKQSSDSQFVKLMKEALIQDGLEQTLFRHDGRFKRMRRWIDYRPRAVRGIFELESNDLISYSLDGSLRFWRIAKAPNRRKPIISQINILNQFDLKNCGQNSGLPIELLRGFEMDQGGVTSIIALRSCDLITGGYDGSLRRWRNGRSMDLGYKISTGQGQVWSLLQLTNGDVVSGGSDGTIRRWQNGQIDGDGNSITTGQGSVFSLIELKNGELITGGEDGTLRRWALRPVVAALCGSLDFSSGTYPLAMAPARKAARASCRQVGVAN